jgi:hypothetical protein
MGSSRSVLVMLMLCAALFGCGDSGASSKQPPLGAVTGTVKLDGQPLPDANVEFRGEAGRPTIGRTDSSGRYKMEYGPGMSGVPVGKHKVKISTKINPANDLQDKVPPKYNEKSELISEVKAGDNTVDFDLTTK